MMIHQLGQQILLCILIYLLAVTPPCLLGETETKVNQDEPFPMTVVTSSALLHDISAYFDVFRSSYTKDNEDYDLMIQEFMEKMFFAENGQKAECPSSKILHRENFIKVTYLAYLSAEYFHSFLLCRVHFQTGGPQVDSSEFVKPVSQRLTAQCNSVGLEFRQIMLAYHNVLKKFIGENESIDDKFREMKSFRSARSQHSKSTFPKVVQALYKYIDTLNKLNDDLRKIVRQAAEGIQDKYPNKKMFVPGGVVDDPMLHQLVCKYIQNQIYEENFGLIQEYLREYFAQVVDVGPFDMHGYIIQNDAENVNHEYLRTKRLLITARWFLWRTGVKISNWGLTAAAAAKDWNFFESNTARAKRIQLKNSHFANMHPLQLLRLCEDYRSNVLYLWETPTYSLDATADTFYYRYIGVEWNAENKDDLEFKFVVKHGAD